MKRFFGVVLIILGLTGCLAVAGFFGIGYYLSPQDSLTKVDAIVAISGGETSTRAAEAIQLYKDGWGANIIFSGAALDPTSPSNARTMAAAAQAAGVPSVAIMLDEHATNTRENATDVGVILRSHNYHSIILVTSPYHQRRAYITFRRALGNNFVIVNHSSSDSTWRKSAWWATPESRALTIDELQKVAYEQLSGQAK